jgi:glycosyltransferase involved in cell wall biosynthesis
VHELQAVIEADCGIDEARLLLARAAVVVACSAAVEENLRVRYDVSLRRLRLVHSFINVDYFESSAAGASMALRAAIGASREAIVVGAVGTATRRKGVDLFIQMAHQATQGMGRDIHFVWCGRLVEGELGSAALCEDGRLDGSFNIHFLGERGDLREFLGGIDMLALPSREDPFPLVALEAAAAGKPVVCFAEAGGIPDFVEADAGIVVPYLDVHSFSGAIVQLAMDDERRKSLGRRAREKVRARHDIEVAAKRIADEISLVMNARGS